MQVSKKFAVMLGILGLAAGTAGTVALQTHAATTSSTGTTQTTALKGKHSSMMGSFHGGMGMRGASGTVAAINGNTITLTGKNGTTYTVDASGSNVEKVSQVPVSSIAVGDSLMVNGTASGTAITAKNIVDGQLRVMNK